MGDHQKRVEKIATEITGLTVKAIVTAGSNCSDGRLDEHSQTQAAGENARAICKEVCKEALGSLKAETSNGLPKPGDLIDRVTGKPVPLAQM